MPHLTELVRRRRADALRGGIGSDQVGMLCFQMLQLAQQLVVLGVGDYRRIEDVVAVVVVVDFGAEFFHAFLDFC